jgi:hypothetical protein
VVAPNAFAEATVKIEIAGVAVFVKDLGVGTDASFERIGGLAVRRSSLPCSASVQIPPFAIPPTELKDFLSTSLNLSASLPDCKLAGENANVSLSVSPQESGVKVVVNASATQELGTPGQPITRATASVNGTIRVPGPGFLTLKITNPEGISLTGIGRAFARLLAARERIGSTRTRSGNVTCSLGDIRGCNPEDTVLPIDTESGFSVTVFAFCGLVTSAFPPCAASVKTEFTLTFTPK